MNPAQLSTDLELTTPSLGRAWFGPVGARLARAGTAWLLPIVLLGLWSIASRFALIAPQILPAPGRVVETFVDLIRSGDLLNHGAISFARILGGFAIGAVAGLALGLAMGLSRRVEEYLGPLFKAVSQIPVLGWIPLLMMVVGIGEALKIAVITQAALVPIAVNTAAGIRNVPAAYLEVARVLRFSRLRLVRQVVVPATIPAIFMGLRQGLMQAWLALVTVELLASSEGLGFLIVWGRQLFQLDMVLAAIAIVGAVGLLLDRGLAGIEAWLLPWRREVLG
jgi:sulfonate transport system permease protein